MKARDAWTLGLRIAVGAIFAIAGISKILSFDSYVYVVAQFRLLPEPLIGPFAAATVILETGMGLALLIGLKTRLAASIITALTALFVCAIAINLVRRNYVDCGCFGGLGGARIGPVSVARNLVLLAAAAWTARYREHRFSLDRKLVTTDHNHLATVEKAESWAQL